MTFLRFKDKQKKMWRVKTDIYLTAFNRQSALQLGFGVLPKDT